ncbi:MAG: SRPBCC family protein [Actinobacteria bacterium]|nr:SRPBCC family protein [Actinomycetota bacterium]
MSEETRIVSAERVIAAPAAEVFELIADPSQQPRWDGNDNLSEAAPGQRVHAVGDVFVMALTTQGAVRENHIVEFEEGRRIAWLPAPVGERPPGHLWRWELEEVEGGTLVRHTYDWTELNDPSRMERARQTTAQSLQASIDRLAALAEMH